MIARYTKIDFTFELNAMTFVDVSDAFTSCEMHCSTLKNGESEKKRSRNCFKCTYVYKSNFIRHVNLLVVWYILIAVG